MDISQIPSILGFVAAGLGIITFIPQAYDIHKTKNTKSISLTSFCLFGLGSICWLIYGLFPVSLPIIFVNIAILTISTYIVFMKLKYK